MTHYNLTHDPDSITYEFDGELLGEASSQRDDSIRWTEVRIYRAVSGKYIVHNLGCSDVYHVIGASCASGEIAKVEATDEFTPCPRCSPTLDKSSRFALEVDRSNVTVTTSAQGVIEALYAKDDDGTLYLTKVCRAALDDATKKDPDLGVRKVAV